MLWFPFSEPLFLIMEYAGYGSLQQFLRSSRSPGQSNRYSAPESQTLTSRDLTVFALHVASGMEYIAEKQVKETDKQTGRHIDRQTDR